MLIKRDSKRITMAFMRTKWRYLRAAPNLSLRHEPGVRCHHLHLANRKIIRWTANTIFIGRRRVSQLRSTNCNSILQTFLIKRDASWSRDGISLYGNVNFEIIFFAAPVCPNPRHAFALRRALARSEKKNGILCVRSEGKKGSRLCSNQIKWKLMDVRTFGLVRIWTRSVRSKSSNENVVEQQIWMFRRKMQLREWKNRSPGGGRRREWVVNHMRCDPDPVSAQRK